MTIKFCHPAKRSGSFKSKASEGSFSSVQLTSAVATLVNLGVHAVATHPWGTCSWPKEKKQDDEQNPLGSWSFLFENGVAIGVAEITPCLDWLRSGVEEVSVSSLFFLCFDHSDVGGGVCLLLHWLLHHWLTHWLLHHGLAHWLLHHWLAHWLLHHRLAWLLHHHWLTHWCCHTWLLLHHRLTWLLHHHWLRLHIGSFKNK